MIEKIVIQYLTGLLDVPVYAEQPEDKVDSFVIVEKTSSGREDYINSATIALQSYASTRAKASELNESVKGYMDEIVTLSNVSDSKLNSDYNYTDTSTRHHRYQAVYDLVFFD